MAPACAGSVQVILGPSLRVNGVDNELRKHRNREESRQLISESQWSRSLSQLGALLITGLTPDTREGFAEKTWILGKCKQTDSNVNWATEASSGEIHQTNCHHNQTTTKTCEVCDMGEL